MQPGESSQFEQAASLIADADSLIVAAGAGMGVDSGLPDFRGPDGFWRAYPALGRARIGFEDIADPTWFDRDPELAWGFYGHRLNLYRATKPHRGFDILDRLSDRVEFGSFVYTSNVDGQFTAAGFPHEFIYECHGSLHFLQCTRPCSERIWPASQFEPIVDTESCRLISDLPRCPNCGALARPNTRMFSDGAWNAVRADGQAQAMQEWLDEVRRPVIIECGAGVHIATVRNYCESLVRRRHAKLIRLNPRAADVPGSPHVGIAIGALEGLEALAVALEEQQTRFARIK